MSRFQRGFLRVLVMALVAIPLTAIPATATTKRCAAHPLATPADYQAITNARSASFGAGDVTSMLRLPDARRFISFGDTAYFDLKSSGGSGPLVGFGNNSAWTQSGSCVALFDRGGPGARSWVLPPQTDGSVYWPGASVVVGSRLFVFMTRLFLDRPFGRPVGAAVAEFDLPSLQLARITEIPYFNGRVFGVGAVSDGGYIYTYASQAETCTFCFAGDMYVARVRVDQIQIPSAWQYRTTNGWTSSSTVARPVLKAAVSNTDVQPYGNGFLLVTKTYGIVAPDVEAWFSPNPDGPWTDMGLVFTIPQPTSHVGGYTLKQPYSYNPVVLTSARLGDGGFFAAYNVNSLDASDAQHDGLMAGARFASIPIPPPPSAPARSVVAASPAPWKPTFGVDRGGLVRTVDGGLAYNASHTSSAVAVARTATARGGWIASADGGVVAYGDAKFYGSMGGQHLNRPIVGMTPTPTGRGYWLVATDGGIFGFGDAHFWGSSGRVRLQKPIFAMAATPTGRGYWLVASDGGIFGYGDAKFYGSAGGMHLPVPVSGMVSTPDGRGYWLVTILGRVYAFGEATYAGSAPTPIPGFAIGIVAAPGGYRIVDARGNVYERGITSGQTRILTATVLVAAG